MIKIKCVPNYIFDPKYNMNYVHAMQCPDGTYLYQQCFKSELSAKRKLNQLYKRFGNEFGDKFIICSTSEIER